MAFRPTALQIIGKLLKAIIYSMIAAMCGFLVWRVFFSTIPPRSMTRLSVNETLAEAYGTYGDSLEMFRQKQTNITRADRNYGYFTIVDYVIIPDAKQVQVLLRYNKSMAQHVYEDFGLEQIPDIKSQLFDLTIVRTDDLTPVDLTDNEDSDYLSETRYKASSSAIDTTLLYVYCRVVFENVEADGAVGLFLDIYYNAFTDYEATSYGTLCLYDSTAENVPVKLSSADRAALRKAAE